MTRTSWTPAFGLLLSSLVPVLCAADRWALQFHHDEWDSSLRLTDLQFPSSIRGVASGAILQRGRLQPVVLTTRDGGTRWQTVKVPEVGLALFFLDDSLGWMVTERGIWKTEESGLSWKKVSDLAGILRLHFVDSSRGWAVGLRKRVYETRDGGRSWNPVGAADQPKTNPAHSAYGWIDFAGANLGMIVGWSRPPRKDEPKFPAWMDPENARRQWPSAALILETRDGGVSWRSSVSSLFGSIRRVRLTDHGIGWALIRFQDAFEWPSEIHRIDLDTGRSQRAFRRKDRSVTDLWPASGGLCYLAAVEPVGSLASLPVPGRVRILQGGVQQGWQEMEVDYRARGAEVFLAGRGAGLWAATDTGMILRLERDPSN